MTRCLSITLFPLLKASIAFLAITAFAPSPAQTDIELAILQRTNMARSANGLQPLLWDVNAAKAARNHAVDMIRKQYFSHITPSGKTVADRMWQAGVLEVEVGENIAYYEGYSLDEVATKVVDDWMNSPHHRENILRPEFTHIGVGVSQNNGKIMIVQDFLARPFNINLWIRPSRSLMGVLDYSGSSKATVGFFVDGVLVRSLQPPKWSGSMELSPGSRVVLGLWRSNKYFLACSFSPPVTECDSPKIKWKANYRQEYRDTKRLQISLPPGSYTLGYGSRNPVAFKESKGNVYIEVPVSWVAVWIGITQGDSVKYTHRISLK